MWNPYEKLSGRTRNGLMIGSVFVFLLLWSAVAGFDLVSSTRLPAPWEVAAGFGDLAFQVNEIEIDGETVEEWDSLLLEATLASVWRVFKASLLIIVTGIPLGILMGASPRINAVMSPLVDPFRSAPIVAVLPVMIMWFGIGEGMKVLFLWAGAVVYLIPMVRDAIQAVPRIYWVKVKDLGGSSFENIWYGVIPAAKPRIWDAVAVAVSIEWTYITVAEYINADRGLGKMIQDSRRMSDMPEVFAGIIVIILLALVTYQSMLFAKRKMFPWETQ